VIRYRSAKPVLTPMLPQERNGTIASVVFPTGIDRRDDLVYRTDSTSITGWPTCGLVLRVLTCRCLTAGRVADPPEAKAVRVRFQSLEL